MRILSGHRVYITIPLIKFTTEIVTLLDKEARKSLGKRISKQRTRVGRIHHVWSLTRTSHRDSRQMRILGTKRGEVKREKL